MIATESTGWSKVSPLSQAALPRPLEANLEGSVRVISTVGRGVFSTGSSIKSIPRQASHNRLVYRPVMDPYDSRDLFPANAPTFGRKRSSSPFRKEDESPFRRLRSLSPDRFSSLASSRMSSPAPVALRDPPTLTPPEDHRSTCGSPEGMDHDTGTVIFCFILTTQ